MEDKDQVIILEEILSVIRHEMGNWLNSIKITLEVLEEAYDIFDKEKTMEYIRRVKEMTNAQIKLIQALKEYPKCNIKERVRIPFQELWNELKESVQELINGRDITLEMIENIKDFDIIGDKTAIKRVLINIVENSIEAVEGLERPEIKIKATKDLPYIKIMIFDNGPGIKSEHVKKTYIPLFTTKKGHSGMGIPIAHRLVTQMGGRIHIESNEMGTLVNIWLKGEFNSKGALAN